MNVDVFTINRSFYIGSRYTFKTATGGVLSILFTLFILPVCYYLSYDLLHGTNPNIDQYAVNIIDDWEKPKIPIMVSFPKELLNKTILLEWDDEKYEHYPTNMKNCSDEELLYIFGNRPINTSMVYLCTAYYEVANYKVSLVSCGSSLVNPACGTPCDRDSNVTLTDYTVYLGFEKIDVNKRIDPIVKDIIMITPKVGYNRAYVEHDINRLENDLGLFFKSIDIFYFYSLDNYYYDNTDEAYIFTVEMYYNWYYVFVKSYVKLQVHLTSLLAIIKLLFSIFNFVNWNDFFYCKYFLNLYMTRNVKLLRQKFINGIRLKNLGKH
jgi:hypothetical protein